MPTLAPWAPSPNAAASPRPSASPPAANTGMGATASATWGKSAMAHHVDVKLGSLPSLAYGVDLVHHLRPRPVRSLDEIPRVPQGERDDRCLCLEGGSEGCFVEQRHHMVDREGPRNC